MQHSTWNHVRSQISFSNAILFFFLKWHQFKAKQRKKQHTWTPPALWSCSSSSWSVREAVIEISVTWRLNIRDAPKKNTHKKNIISPSHGHKHSCLIMERAATLVSTHPHRHGRGTQKSFLSKRLHCNAAEDGRRSGPPCLLRPWLLPARLHPHHPCLGYSLPSWSPPKISSTRLSPLLASAAP